MTPRILCIGGMDSSGGAGLLRDSATIQALGCAIRVAVTAVTAQDTHAVTASHPIPIDTIRAQIAHAGPVQAVKIGMLCTSDIVRTVAQALPEGFRVLDPVLLSSSGYPLLDARGVDTLLTELMPKMNLLTPNLPELIALARRSGCETEDRDTCVRALLDQGARAILVKGGHAGGTQSVDYLYSGVSPPVRFSAPRVQATLRGTGCRLASAIACEAANGTPLDQAVQKAKAYVHKALRTAKP